MFGIKFKYTCEIGLVVMSQNKKENQKVIV